MSNFNAIFKEEGLIKGELANGSLVTIPNKKWAEVDEDTVEGNWEQTTRAAVRDIIDRGLLKTNESTETLSIDHDRFADVLTDSSIVEHNDHKKERQRAELLLEHLIRESIYEQRGQEIVVLDNLDASPDKFSKLNWAAYFSYVVEEIDSLVKSAKNQKAEITEYLEQETEIEADFPSERELIEELAQITGSNIKPVGVDEDGYPVPPEGVVPENKWEYKRLWTDLETLIENKRGIHTIQTDIKKRVEMNIRIIKRMTSRIIEIEKQLREAPEKNMVNTAEIQEKVYEIQKFVDNILVGKTTKRNLAEVIRNVESYGGI